MELILASTSPSRKAVLVLSGIPFKVVPSNVEEVIDQKPNQHSRVAIAAVDD